MRDGSNKKLIVLSLLVMLCLLAFYKVTKYYSDKDIKPEIRVADEEEINLGLVEKGSSSTSTPTCNNNQKLVNNRCVSKGCADYTVDSCPTGCIVKYDGSTRVCTSSSITCNSDQKLVNNECVPKVCADYTVANCPTGCNIKYDGSTRVCTSPTCSSNQKVDGTKCVPKECTVNITTSFTKASYDDAVSFVVSLKGDDCDGTEDITLSSSGITLPGNSIKSGTIIGTIKSNDSCESTASVTASFNNSSSSASINTIRPWYQTGGSVCTSSPSGVQGRDAANAAGTDIYWVTSSGCNSCSNQCVQYWARGCASPPTIPVEACYTNGKDYKWTSSPPDGYTTKVEGVTKKEDCEPKCYADASALSIAEHADWLLPINQPLSLPHLLVHIKKKEDCVINSRPTLCEPATTVCSNSDKNATTCNGDVLIEYTDGISCDGQSFYEIKCTNKVKTNFNSGLSNYPNYLPVGLGFKYEVTITTERECKATFNTSNWNEAYNLTIAKINQANSEMSIDKEAAESVIYGEKINQENLNNMKTAYNNFDPTTTYNDNESGDISLNYQINAKPANSNANFVLNVINEGKGQYYGKSSDPNNPTNYTWSNKNNPRIVKLTLPKVYFDKETGKTPPVTKNVIDGGNKLYIDYNTDPGTYNINVKVSGVGCSSINNDKCSITVKENEILYRPIDLSNPFINNKWTPGSNWVNNKFDFRNIIHSDIWSK